MIYACCDERRRDDVRQSALNGIDYLEVRDRDEPNTALRQRVLHLHFVNAPAPLLAPEHIRISGGERVRGISVVSDPKPDLDPNDSHVLVVTVDQPGDFSRYTLSLARSATDPRPPADIDPMLAMVDFSFKAECPSDFDCQPGDACFPPSDLAPEIDYLAKDYASFRRLMLDRMAVLAPHWPERNAADLGIALVELFAFVGDYLSYQQDAIATEAYLRTARRRVSVRRHALLVDYAMHDGSNARTWVQLQVGADVATPHPPPPPLPPPPSIVPKGTPLCTRLLDQPPRLADRALLSKAGAIFETMEDTDALYQDHNEIHFYTWSDNECCLPAGATRATLQGHLPGLKARNCDPKNPLSSDVLIFEEVRGPLSGEPADADPAHRWAVRLTSVQARDDQGNHLTDLVTGDEITEIAWADEDALPFPLCISARPDEEHGTEVVPDISVARGNIVLVDHGRTLDPEDLCCVPDARLFLPPASDPCARPPRVPIPPRYRPSLRYGPLTQAAPLVCGQPASAVLRATPEKALPAICLDAYLSGQHSEWEAQRDLLGSHERDRVFVAETEEDGIATLRFGDDQHGLRPEKETHFWATYRIGNGVQGNVGREAIAHIFSGQGAITGVRNPLPAQGGADPESLEDVRQRAPSAFRTQQRAVTEADYAAVAQRHPGIQRAAATFRWTGSWHTVFLTVDRLGGQEVDPDFERDMLAYVEPYRMAGYDLEADGPRPVALQLTMRVCVNPAYFRSDVKAALLEVFSNRDLPGGRRGLFHPDRFTFGQTVYLSPLYAAAQEVAGVDSVEIVAFGRMGSTDPKPLQDGQLRLDRLEIARLDNDPNFPERGVFTLTMLGGK